MGSKLFKTSLLVAPLLMGVMAAPSMASSVLLDLTTSLSGQPTLTYNSGSTGGVVISGNLFDDTNFPIIVAGNDTVTITGLTGGPITGTGVSGDPFLVDLTAAAGASVDVENSITGQVLHGTISNGTITALANGGQGSLLDLSVIYSVPSHSPSLTGTFQFDFNNTLTSTGNGLLSGIVTHGNFTEDSGTTRSTPLPAAFGPGMLLLGGLAFFGKRRMNKAAV